MCVCVDMKTIKKALGKKGKKKEAGKSERGFIVQKNISAGLQGRLQASLWVFLSPWMKEKDVPWYPIHIGTCNLVAVVRPSTGLEICQHLLTRLRLYMQIPALAEVVECR